MAPRLRKRESAAIYSQTRETRRNPLIPGDAPGASVVRPSSFTPHKPPDVTLKGQTDAFRAHRVLRGA